MPICGKDIFSELVQESHGLHFTLVTTWAKDPHFVDTEFFWRMDSGLRMIYYEGKLYRFLQKHESGEAWSNSSTKVSQEYLTI